MPNPLAKRGDTVKKNGRISTRGLLPRLVDEPLDPLRRHAHSSLDVAIEDGNSRVSERFELLDRSNR